MSRKFLAVIWCILSVSAYSCNNAVPTDDPTFCESFKSVAICYCTSSGLPGIMCQDMNMLYRRMTSIFGSLDKACQYQKHTSKQDCLDNWNCYRTGGIDSRGRLCSGTKKSCS